MNILELVFSKAWGGLEILVGVYAEKFKERGHNVTCLIESNERLEENLKKNNIPYYTIKPVFKYLDILSAFKAKSLLKNKNIDVIHTHISKDLSTAVLIKKMLQKGKIVFTQHMDSRHKKKDFFHKWIYKNIDFVASITDSMRQNHLKFTPITEDKITTIYNGIDLNKFNVSPDFEPVEFKKTKNIPPGKIIIGTIGRIDRLKNQEILINCAEKLVKTNKNIHFIFVGEETDSITGRGYRNELLSRIKEKKLEDYFSVFNFSQEIEKYFNILDIFVLTTPKESFGLVLLEAMSMGKPVLGTNSGGPPEIISDGESGFLYNPYDYSELSDKLRILIETEELRKKMGKKGQKRVKQKFNLEKKIDDYIDLFERLKND